MRLTASPAFSYLEVGAVTRSGPLPAGYHHLHHQELIGYGRDVLEAAGEAVTTLRMHRAAGVRVRTDLRPDTPRVAPGTEVVCALGFGPLRLDAPCRVLWAGYGPNRFGFSYGTRPGHPECGEESFIVDLRADGSVWFTVTAFSRPGRWYTRLAGPAVPLFQRAYARRCASTLRRLAAG
ncbi:uncharacterized protein (UPF0548 family) [Kitasatospora sp. MAA4]|uniref:DUF1990 family protein n=1 Tax=Kitasatospora sp. MAA4 TaxID=3035093 RepID=UPI0024749198|nr:DUF1990 domain-containing protein [Kitasatospora sp. MAA4]MDH6136761.1 uncharacterized protein (UPF0548 family) [Kitasatospora sp. MAA4]